jgi:hypothetical protein
MARPKRKQLKFDEDSVNKLLQEIYDDTHNIRAKIARLFTKWEAKVKENGEVAAIGDQIVKLIAAEAKNQDQKIMLLRYLKEVVFEKNKEAKGNGSGSSFEETGEISSERRNELLNMVQKEVERIDNDKK